MEKLKKQAKAFLKLVEKRRIVEVVLPINRALGRTTQGVYVIDDADTMNTHALRGIWLHIQNYPGRNRGLRIYFYFQFPHFVVPSDADAIESLDPRLLLRGKYLHYNLDQDGLDKLEDHMAKFEKIILACMYLYTREKDEEDSS